MSINGHRLKGIIPLVLMEVEKIKIKQILGVVRIIYCM